MLVVDTDVIVLDPVVEVLAILCAAVVVEPAEETIELVPDVQAVVNGTLDVEIVVPTVGDRHINVSVI